MANQYQNMYANSTVPCSVFVIPDTSHFNSVKTATVATTRPTGISMNSRRKRPDPDFTGMDAQSGQVAAIAGEGVGVWVDGAASIDLYCNATWTTGDLLMADGSGFGIVATTGNYYGARACATGVVGALCPVDVVIGYKA